MADNAPGLRIALRFPPSAARQRGSRSTCIIPFSFMHGLVPCIHVDPRAEPGDGRGRCRNPMGNCGSAGPDRGGACSAVAAGRYQPAHMPILFLIVFIDLVGFGLVIPLLPFYGVRFGRPHPR